MASTGGMLDSWQQLERWADRHTAGIRGKARLVSARADSVRQAIRLSEGLAVYWILRDFCDLNLQGVVNDIVEVLRQCLIVMLTTTGGGALIGGIAGGIGGVGAGAVPGARCRHRRRRWCPGRRVDTDRHGPEGAGRVRRQRHARDRPRLLGRHSSGLASRHRTAAAATAHCPPSRLNRQTAHTLPPLTRSRNSRSCAVNTSA